MTVQLFLPIKGQKPARLRAPDITPEAPKDPVVVTHKEDDEKGAYERLFNELEGLIVHLQKTIPYGPEWQKAWAKARKDTCESYGWTDEEFYAEMDRRHQER